MGAFGSNTMTFEQWLQFILIPRIQQIIKDHDEFPSGSMLGTYAIRVFDGDYETAQLQELLYDIDQLINVPEMYNQELKEVDTVIKPDTVAIGDTTLPEVIYTLIEILPQFEGDDLENQLRTYDTFLSILAPSVRPALSALLQKAASKTLNPVSKQRIENASRSVAQGGRAAEAYDHDEAMKKYQEEHKRNFPS